MKNARISELRDTLSEYRDTPIARLEPIGPAAVTEVEAISTLARRAQKESSVDEAEIARKILRPLAESGEARKERFPVVP